MAKVHNHLQPTGHATNFRNLPPLQTTGHATKEVIPQFNITAVMEADS
jgi:hypothetical protein